MNRRKTWKRFKGNNLHIGFVSVLIISTILLYFFNHKNQRNDSFDYGIIPNESNYFSENDIPDWHTIAARTFLIVTSKTYTYFELAGTDSYVGGFTNQKDTFFFDYGLYSNTLTEFTAPTYTIRTERINNKKFRIVIGHPDNPYIAAITNESDKGKSLMIECPNCRDIEEKHQIIHTIKFK